MTSPSLVTMSGLTSTRLASCSSFWTTAGYNLYAKTPELVRERLAMSNLPDGIRESLTAKWEKNRLGNHAKRNAQNLASVYSSAIAAGATFQGSSPEELVRELGEGITGADS